MKRIVLSVFSLSIVLIGLSIVLSSSSQGRAFATNAGNTGAPGESIRCSNCHTGGNFSTTTYQIELLDSSNNPVSSYIPGYVYTLRGSFSTPTGNPRPTRYGFQVVSLVGTNTTYNAWSNASTNARIASASNGRSYTEHRGPSSSGTYTVNWTAPVVGTGSVTFYSASNGVNLNSGTSGDNGYATQLTITENISTDLIDLNEVSEFNLYPNPVQKELFISSSKPIIGELMIFDQTRKVVRSRQFVSSSIFVNMEDLPNGLYFLQLVDQSGNRINMKVVKN